MSTDPFEVLDQLQVEEAKEGITQDNYYEKRVKYFSYSQIKGFRDCEAKELAKVKREYKEEPTRPMILGSYFHSAFESESEFERFQEKNGEELFKRNGEKFADVIQIDKMIETIKADEYAIRFLKGEKEQVFTGEIYGLPFKIRVDNVNHFEEFFSDLKSSKGLYEKYWDADTRKYVSFLEKFDYILQMAIYQEILLQNVGIKYKPFIIASTKEVVPDKAVFHFEQWRLDDAIMGMKDEVLRYDLIKQELVEPNRCERCDYCKETKKLYKTIEVGEITV